MSDAPDKKKSSGGRVAKLIALVLVAGAIALGYFVRDCGFGPGLGGQKGSGGEAAKPPEATPPAGATDSKTTAPVNVIVRGDQCVVDGGKPELCTTACETIARRAVPEAVVSVDAALGTQAAVEGLRSCLGAKGYRAVRIDAGETGGSK